MSSNTPARVRVAGASLVGTAIEWYDFFIYGTCAALIFPKLFFANLSPTAALVVSFSTYAVGFFARPLGALLFGHYGDKVGRKKMLSLSLLLMGVSTVAIGLLPTYETAGALGAFLLIFLRILQGFAVGGEWGSAVVMAVEHAPAHRKGLFGSFVQIGVPAGLLLSTIVFTTVTTLLSEEDLYSWGWRIPFLLSSVLILVGVYIRHKLEESPEFEQITKEKGKIAKAPIAQVFKNHWLLILQIAGMRTMQNTMFNFCTVFLLSYISKDLGLPKTEGLHALMIAATIGLVTVPFWGYLSDKLGRKAVCLWGNIITTTVVFPIFWMINDKTTAMIVTAMIIGFIAHDIVYGAVATYIAQLFPTEVRLTGANVSYSLGSLLSGLMIPLFPIVLDGWGYEGIGILLTGIGLVSILSTASLRKLPIVRSEEPAPKRVSK